METNLQKAAKKAAKELAVKKPKKKVVKKATPKKVTPTKPTLAPEVQEKYDEVRAEITRNKFKPNKEEWDVEIGEEITYFDPSLSYEITGYRPVTMTQGLDFDPTVFTQTAQIFEETGNYTTYLPGFKLHADFWEEQRKRCIHGMTVGKYTITGDNYFFLNFYRLMNPDKITKAAEGREETFPSFYSKQYEWFHYVELAEKLGFDCGALKPRAVGWSEIAASMGTKTYTVIKRSKCIYAAQMESQITDTLSKCWQEMEFLNTSTNRGFKHVRMVKNSDMIKRASKKTKDGTEGGWMSEIEGRVIDNPRKLRGARVERLFFEESGSNTHLRTSYNQSEALIRIMGKRIGTRFVWGTGGDHGVQLEGLADMFYNPKSYEILPFKNNYNQKKEVVYTAFFLPAYTMASQYLDSRGVCDEVSARIYYESMRVKKSDSAKTLLEYKSETCFYPEEALIREGESRFDMEKLAEQVANIELHKLVKPPKRGTLKSPLNEDGRADLTQMPFFVPDVNGPIHIIEHPMMDENNIPYRNLYVAGIDSIDADEDSSSGQKDVSDFCIVIKKRQLGLQDPKYVAIYKERPKDVRTAYEIAIRLLMWYNCKAVVETSRVSIITYFKEKNKLNLLFKRPQATLPSLHRRNNHQYGATASPNVIEHQLELVEIFINDYCHTIEFIDMLNELLKYSYVNKRKFDIVAAMGMAELGDEELFGNAPRLQQVQNATWKDIGYYVDEYGVKKYGIIPTKQSNQIKGRVNYDWIGK